MSEKSLIDLAKEHGQSIPAENSPLVGNVPENTGDMDKLNALLSNVSPLNERWVEVRLPSNGLSYDATVKVRPFYFDEEVALKTKVQGDNASKVIADILQNCVQGVELWKMYIPDRDFLLFKIRELTYGKDYPIEAACTCGKINKMTLDISLLPVKYADGLSCIMAIALPDSCVTAFFRLPMGADNDNIATQELRYKNMYRFISELHINKLIVTDSKIIAEFIKRTTAKDVSIIHNEIYKDRFGLESTVLFDCASCGKDNKTQLGLNESFFTAS